MTDDEKKTHETALAEETIKQERAKTKKLEADAAKAEEEANHEKEKTKKTQAETENTKNSLHDNVKTGAVVVGAAVAIAGIALKIIEAKK